MAWIGLLMYASAQSAHSLCALVRNTTQNKKKNKERRSSMRWVSPDMTCSSTAGRDTMNGACRQIQDLIVLHRPRNSNVDYSAAAWMPPHHFAAAASMNGLRAFAAWPTSSDQRYDV